MKKQLIICAVLCSAAALFAAPPAPPEKNGKNPPPPAAKPDRNNAPKHAAPEIKKPTPKPDPGPAAKHPAPKPQPAPVHKPVHAHKPAHPSIIPPLPVHQVVSYRPVRNSYTIQLNAGKTILFEQRIVGIHELRDKIRMISNDRPRPLITIKVSAGVDNDRLNFTINELRKAGFNDTQVIRLARRTKVVPAPRKPAPRIKR